MNIFETYAKLVCRYPSCDGRILNVLYVLFTGSVGFLYQHEMPLRSERIVCMCETCGSEFHLPDYELKHRPGKYCSKRCRAMGFGGKFWELPN